MNIKRIEREVIYRLTDSNNNEHSYTIASACDASGENSTIEICGSGQREEIEIPASKLPFFIETLNLFARDYSLMKQQP